MLVPLPVQNSITETGMARQIRKKSEDHGVGSIDHF